MVYPSPPHRHSNPDGGSTSSLTAVCLQHSLGLFLPAAIFFSFPATVAASSCSVEGDFEFIPGQTVSSLGHRLSTLTSLPASRPDQGFSSAGSSQQSSATTCRHCLSRRSRRKTLTVHATDIAHPRRIRLAVASPVHQIDLIADDTPGQLLALQPRTFRRFPPTASNWAATTRNLR